jgi:hypothetical protein
MLPSFRFSEHQFAIRLETPEEASKEAVEETRFLILPCPFPPKGTVFCVLKTQRREVGQRTIYTEKTVIFTDKSFPADRRSLAVGYLEHAIGADAGTQTDTAFAVESILQTYVTDEELLDPF